MVELDCGNITLGLDGMAKIYAVSPYDTTISTVIYCDLVFIFVRKHLFTP